MDPFIIRNYQKGDEEGITSLFKEVFGKELTIEQWNWKYVIPGKGRIYSKLAEDTSHKIIGHAGAIPLRGVFKNKPIHVFQIVDVMVHPEARGFLGRKSVFDSLMKTMFEDIREEFHDVFCYGFPGKRPFTLGKRIGVYDNIEQGTDCLKPLKRSLLNPFTIKTINWDDKSLNTLWKRVSKEFSLSIIRDKDYLHWRYATNPYFSYYLYGFFLLGKLKGWAVIRMLENEVLVVDLLTEPKRFRNILKALGNYLISQGKKVIRIWLPENLKKYIKDYIQKEKEVVVTNMVWKLPFATYIVRKNLYYTMGDVDIF